MWRENCLPTVPNLTSYFSYTPLISWIISTTVNPFVPKLSELISILVVMSHNKCITYPYISL